MSHTLYVIHGSHPCATVEKAMELKGVPYRRFELPPALHALHQQVRFGVRTVPALRLDGGEKLVGSRSILRRLEALAPEPALWPSDPDERARVEAAEAWGDETYQPVARRLLWPGFARNPRAMSSSQDGSRLPKLPGPALTALAPAVIAAERRLNSATDERMRAALAALPGHVERIDGWLADGVLGGDRPNAADLQIAATTRLLLTMDDLAPLLADHPAREHALALFESWPGRLPAGTLPV